MFKVVRNAVKRMPTVRNWTADYLGPMGVLDPFILRMKLSPAWQGRINDVIACGDNEMIPRVEDSGIVRRGVQTMHNGIKINVGSYYGPEIAQLLQRNRGVHEPQEERVFQEVLTAMPAGATMIELGSYWSFYSMWFQSRVHGAKNFMIEPDPFNYRCGIKNFRLNKMDGDFLNAFIGQNHSASSNPPVICIDQFVNEKSIEHIHMLHSDIQGFEHEMLLGATETIDSEKVDFVFISTHSNEVHRKCLEFLRERSFFIIAECDLDHSFSVDGLIAAHAPSVRWNRAVSISRKGDSASHPASTRSKATRAA